MNKKLLLVQPSPYDSHRRPIKRRRLEFVGLALPYLAALTPPDWEVELCLETIEDIPFDGDAGLVGIGSMGHGVVRSLDVARRFRALGKPVVMGGYMASLMAGEVGKACDAVVVGDAEEVWTEVLRDAEAGRLKPIYRRALRQLDTPLPRYELLLDKRIGGWLPVQAGRGCPNHCTFCSVACLYRGRYFRRPIEGVVRDLRRVRELGFRRFLLLDDNLYADPDYLRELCRAMAPLRMRWMSQCAIAIGEEPELLRELAAAGCTALSFGLESISAESLRTLDKGWADPADYPRLIAAVQDAGIDVSTEMVVGADGDTLESIRATADFIRETGIVLPRFYILTPIPGTDFHAKMRSEGRLCNTDLYSYNGCEAVHRPRHMSPEALTQAYWELYETVYRPAAIARRTLGNRRLWRRPGRCVFYWLANLSYRQQIRRRIPPNIY